MIHEEALSELIAEVKKQNTAIENLLRAMAKKPEEEEDAELEQALGLFTEVTDGIKSLDGRMSTIAQTMQDIKRKDIAKIGTSIADIAKKQQETAPIIQGIEPLWVCILVAMIFVFMMAIRYFTGH